MAGGLSSGKEAARVRRHSLGGVMEEVDAELTMGSISIHITERLRRLRFPGSHSQPSPLPLFAMPHYY